MQTNLHLQAFLSKEIPTSDASSNPRPSSGQDSHEDAEIFSDIVLTYMNQILMEEDSDEKLDMLQEHPALLAAEKSFYDILADTQFSSSSSNRPTFPSNHHSSDNDSLNPQGEPPAKSTNSRRTLQGVDNLEAEEGRSLKQSALGFDTEVPPEMLDALLFKECKGNRQVETCYKTSHGGTKSGTKKKLEKKESVVLDSLLIQCAQAISENDLPHAHKLLNQIRQHSTPFGDSNQRLAHCFANGLEARLTGGGGGGSVSYYFQSPPPATVSDMLKAHQIYLAAAPFKKISDFFAHQNILNVSGKSRRLHIIDFGIYHGFMWPCFLQRLSTLPGGAPMLRITGIDFPQPGFRPAERVEETGRRLSEYARRFDIPFQYHPIACKWEALQLEDFGIEEDEVLVVNCMNRLQNLADESVSPDNPRDQVLNTIRKLKPDVFVLGIVNGTYNTPFFLRRFKEAMFHFSALLDMLETNVGREDEHRRLLERHFFEREAFNVISCEGLERVERPETYKQWKTRSERAGLVQVPLDADIVRKSRWKLKRCYHKDFMVVEDGKWLLQGWKGRILYGLSAWRTRDRALKESS
ncbi:hypothetical protein IEQ34_008523 [Dendrobium chrysotoxum]|uniref:Scarecrow-like protein 9 n=1 Tax=Dendrobium chrysotoxum TaxID=161865 RepID=A0AAV7GZ61_DENCH|nr:hypothetical protein IEQ34_008523 [Dendrobium chrysotoxum]